MTAPFEIGDKVVRVAPIAGEATPGMKVGSVYTVTDIWYCCSHVGYRMTLAEVECRAMAALRAGRKISCGAYASYHEVTDKAGWKCSLFARVSDADITSDHTVESLLEELSEPVKELQPA